MNGTSSCRILIIEDERIDREIYKRCFQNSSTCRFEFAESDSAIAGIELSRTWAPDCMLLDFNLPDMNGLDVLNELRDRSNRLPCAIVMLTSFGGEELAVKAMKGGAMDYLSKGRVDADSLPHSVLNAIQRFRLQQRVEEQRVALEQNARRWQALLESIPQMVWMTGPDGRIEYANRNWLEYTGQKDRSADLNWGALLHPDDVAATASAWQYALENGTPFEVEHRLKRDGDGTYLWHLVRAVPLHDASGTATSWFGCCTDIERQRQAEQVNLQNEKLQSIGQLAAGVAHDFNNLLVSILGGASYAMEKLPEAHSVQEVLQDVVRAGERAAELTAKLLAYAGKGFLSVEPADLNRLVLQTCAALRSTLPRSIKLEVASTENLPLINTDCQQLNRVIEALVRNAAEAIGESAGTISVHTRVLEPGGETGPQVPAVRCIELEVADTGCGMSPETVKRIFDPFFTTKFMGRGLSLAAVQGFIRRAGGAVHVDSAPGKGTRFRVVLPAPESVARSLVS